VDKQLDRGPRQWNQKLGYRSCEFFGSGGEAESAVEWWVGAVCPNVGCSWIYTLSARREAKVLLREMRTKAWGVIDSSVLTGLRVWKFRIAGCTNSAVNWTQHGDLSGVKDCIAGGLPSLGFGPGDDRRTLSVTPQRMLGGLETMRTKAYLPSVSHSQLSFLTPPTLRPGLHLAYTHRRKVEWQL